MEEVLSTRAQEADRVHPVPMLLDGVVAGLIGAFVAALAHLVADAAVGVPLRTPTVLGQLVIGGLASTENVHPDVQTAFWLTCIHMILWSVLGTLGSWLISLVDAHPRLLAAIFGGFVIGFVSLLYAAGAFSIPGLPPLHLWIGSLLGSGASAAYLAQRHPKLMGHVGRAHLTPTTIAEIVRALAHERAAVAAYEAAATLHPIPTLKEILEEKRARVLIALGLADEFDLPTDEATEPLRADDEPCWTVTDLDTALRSAPDAERRTVEFYDRFLYSVSELEVRNVFLRLRYHVADSTIPLIEDTVEPEA